MIQDRPVCFRCLKSIEHDPVFAPPWCEVVEEHASAVFHGLCLMEHREQIDRRRKAVAEIIRKHDAGECDCFGKEDHG